MIYESSLPQLSFSSFFLPIILLTIGFLILLFLSRNIDNITSEKIPNQLIIIAFILISFSFLWVFFIDRNLEKENKKWTENTFFPYLESLPNESLKIKEWSLKALNEETSEYLFQILPENSEETKYLLGKVVKTNDLNKVNSVEFKRIKNGFKNLQKGLYDIVFYVDENFSPIGKIKTTTEKSLKEATIKDLDKTAQIALYYILSIFISGIISLLLAVIVCEILEDSILMFFKSIHEKRGNKKTKRKDNHQNNSFKEIEDIEHFYSDIEKSHYIKELIEIKIPEMQNNISSLKEISEKLNKLNNPQYKGLEKQTQKEIKILEIELNSLQKETEEIIKSSIEETTSSIKSEFQKNKKSAETAIGYLKK